MIAGFCFRLWCGVLRTLLFLGVIGIAGFDVLGACGVWVCAVQFACFSAVIGL